MQKNIQSADFRDRLKELFEEKQEKNNRISIRGWSKILGVSAASLSRLMRKEIPLSNKLFFKMAEKFQLSEEEIEFFKRSTKQKSFKLCKEELVNFGHPGAPPELEILSNWIYTAIMASVRLEPRLSNEDLGNLLGLSNEKFASALKNLEAANLIHFEDGLFQLTGKNFTTTHISGVNEALSTRKIQSLENSIQSVKNDIPDIRDHSEVNLAIDISLLPLAKEKIRNFRRELATYLEEHSKKPNAVYSLDIGFFPLIYSGKARSPKSETLDH